MTLATRNAAERGIAPTMHELDEARTRNAREPLPRARSIARRFGVTVGALLAANPDITDPTSLATGQVILIPPTGWAPNPSPSPG